ncbi:MAG: hypothetical protein COS34_14630 [Lysobacterales bacterium CG02_land_8_20_14_3_00_62_12]|nr:MAG: hypothetical protein COS34_14630 [Xanthomonadales bacterium CG02_land_8_20_14_3_00_62_12]
MSDIPAVKVLFRVPDDDGGAIVETLWANPLGEDRYELDNSPFYAYGVSWRDTIFAPMSQEEGWPTFECVVEKSGHRTVRVIFDPPVAPRNVSDQVLQGLVQLGCSYEGANPGYMSVNIPPGVELEQICSYLVGHEAQWEHADPTYASLYPDDA